MTGHDEWLEWRRQGIGASDVAGILGLSPWASPWSVWANKTGLAPDSETTDAMRFGQLAEAVIGPWFTERTGLTVTGQQERCEHPDEPWARCTLDGRAIDPETGEQVALVEMKTTSASAAEWDTEIPIHYRCQAAWQCYVTGTERVMFAVIHMAFGRLEFRTYLHEPDPADIEHAVTKCRTFWMSHVVTGLPPETDSSEATSLAISDVWGSVETDSDDTIDMTDHATFRHAVTEWERAKRDKTAAEDRVRAAANKLRVFLGEHSAATIDGQQRVSWRSQVRNTLDTKAVHADHGTKYNTATTVRVLRSHTPKGTK